MRVGGRAGGWVGGCMHGRASACPPSQPPLDSLPFPRLTFLPSFPLGSRAIFEYLLRGEPTPHLDLAAAVQVCGWGGGGTEGARACGGCPNPRPPAAVPAPPCLPLPHNASPRPLLPLPKTNKLKDEAFMDSIDPEVRADIECAARLLARRAGAPALLADSADSGAAALQQQRAGGEELQQQLIAAAAARGGGSLVDCAGFGALMEEVLSSTKGEQCLGVCCVWAVRVGGGVWRARGPRVSSA